MNKFKTSYPSQFAREHANGLAIKRAGSRPGAASAQTGPRIANEIMLQRVEPDLTNLLRRSVISALHQHFRDSGASRCSSDHAVAVGQALTLIAEEMFWSMPTQGVRRMSVAASRLRKWSARLRLIAPRYQIARQISFSRREVTARVPPRVALTRAWLDALV